MKREHLLIVLALLVALMLALGGCTQDNVTTLPAERHPDYDAERFDLSGSISGTVYLDDTCPGPVYYYPYPTPTPPYCCPSEGAAVAVYFEGVLKAQTLTNAAGEYRFERMRQGLYTIEVTYPAYYHTLVLDDVVVMAKQENDAEDAYFRPLYKVDEIYVYFDPAVTLSEVTQAISNCGCTISPDTPTWPGYYYLLDLPAGMQPEEAIECTEAQPMVTSAGYSALCYGAFIINPLPPFPIPVFPIYTHDGGNILAEYQ